MKLYVVTCLDSMDCGFDVPQSYFLNKENAVAFIKKHNDEVEKECRLRHGNHIVTSNGIKQEHWQVYYDMQKYSLAEEETND